VENQCVPDQCLDGSQNGTETDVDCGGGACPACRNGAACFDPTDCASGDCAEGLCRAVSCGNGTIEAGETCDDANSDAADGCSPGCVVEDGWTCAGTPSACHRLATCGDDLAEGAEVCDGLDLGGRTCASLGYISGDLACAGDCKALDTSGCLGTPVCGDGVAVGLEVCDGSDLRGESCLTQCFGSGALGCQLGCGGFDTSGCVGVPTCGDDVAAGDEVCDGPDLDGETCLTQASVRHLACAADCTGFDTSACRASRPAGTTSRRAPRCATAPTSSSDLRERRLRRRGPLLRGRLHGPRHGSCTSDRPAATTWPPA
jgi:cysteine-rich repeat protein